MRKLLYKGIIFDDFMLYNLDPEKYGNGNVKSLDGFSSVSFYVCPRCIKKHNLYNECCVTEKVVEAEIEAEAENVYEGMVCGVYDCYNTNSYDGYISTKECQLIETVPDFEDGNFIDDVEKMRDFKTLSKEEFLKSYSYLTEAEYDNTMKIYTFQGEKSDD